MAMGEGWKSTGSLKKRVRELHAPLLSFPRVGVKGH